MITAALVLAAFLAGFASCVIYIVLSAAISYARSESRAEAKHREQKIFDELADDPRFAALMNSPLHPFPIDEAAQHGRS